MDEKTILLFDDYIQGALSLEEQRGLEARIQKEPELADAFEIFKELNGHLNHQFSAERSDVLGNLEELANTHLNTEVKQEAKVIAFKPWRYLIAASVVVLFGALFWMNMGDPSYGDYAFDQEINLTERGDGELAFAKAEKAFNAHSYEEAIMFFDSILSNAPDNAEVAYYKGIALVELGQHEAAESLFERLSEGGSVYKYKSIWYNALSHLKRKDIAGTKRLLEKVPQDAEDYDKAQELLSDL